MTISGEPTVSRRRLLTYGAVTGAAVALAPTIPGLTPPASASGVPDVLPLPEPIPGGFTLPDGTVFHVLPPGPPTVTLPFSQLPLQGLDVEPSVITDYAGFTCLAFHAGSATGSDGRQYNLETDMRVMDGTYRTADGSRRHGAFAFIWVDLYEPGSGSQVHDLNGGIQPNGLFWIVELHDHNFDVSRNGRRARLRVENESVLDSFVFGGPSAVPATVSFTVEWNATGEREKRGKGSTVPPTDPGAFLGNFADARSTGSFRATQLGFGFQSNPGVSTDLGWAEMGTERNGAFLR